MLSLDELNDALSALRLCEPKAVEAMAVSLTSHGQLSPLVVFDDGPRVEVIDGFKRLQAARRLKWPRLEVRFCNIDITEAKLQVSLLHAGRGLTELEEGWLVRSLYRDEKLSQPAIAERLGRHKSWVCRRLMLVEGLVDEVQACVRLGLLAPRSAVLLAALPRGNQTAAMGVVTHRGLTVRQTELLVAQINALDDTCAQVALLEHWSSGQLASPQTGPRPTRAIRSEADWVAADLTTIQRVAARLNARLLATPLRAFGPAAAELIAAHLESLLSALTALHHTITTVTTPKETPIKKEQSAA